MEKEFALLFMVFDENLSWYLDDNILTYLNLAADSDIKEVEDFYDSNKKYSKYTPHIFNTTRDETIWPFYIPGVLPIPVGNTNKGFQVIPRSHVLNSHVKMGV